MKKSTCLALITLSLLFMTSAGWSQTTIYTQDFEGTGLPTDWSQVTNADDGGWKFGTNTQLQSASFPISAHTKMACTNDDACNCDKSNDMLISPAMDFTAYSNVFMSFDNYYYNLSYGGATEKATIQASTDGGTTWTVVKELAGNTGDWETRFVDLSAYAGQSNVKVGFNYNDGGDWLYGWAMDNVLVYAPVAGVDAGVSSLQIGKLDPTPTFISFSKYFTDLPLSVKASISNLGTVPITSFDVSWTNGTTTYDESLTGLNIGTFESYSFTSASNYTTLSGSHTISLTISNINGGSAEISTDNNDGNFTITGVVPNPDQHYVAEEATGTWCGWCVRGIVFMDYMRENYPDQFVGIAVHNGDPMQVTAYDNWVGSFPGFLGYPSVIINRNYIVDPSELENDFIDNASNTPAVKVTVDPQYNIATKELTVTVNGEFLQNLNGDYRFVAVLQEDSVHGTSSTYKQTNYYSIADYGYAGPMAGFEYMSGHIAASEMYYDFVGKALLSDVEGTAGSLPGSITSGTNYSYTYTYTVPASFNVNRLKVVGMVVDYSTGEVLNAGKNGLKFVTGINDQVVNASLFMYPNPARDVAYLDLKITKAEKVTVQIVNILGQTVAVQDLGSVSGSQVIPVNVKNFATGVYQLKVTVGDQVLTKKLEVIN
ncbi:MAG: Omp28-related outer membrane protein [Chitinophagales bacterium]